MLCQLARLLRAQTCHFCIFFPVADERSGRTPIWACQRMGLPSSLSGEKREIQTGSVSCSWRQKIFVTPFLLISCAFCLFCTLINLETEAEGLKDHSAATLLQLPCCSHQCLPTALHLVPEPCAALVLGG